MQADDTGSVADWATAFIALLAFLAAIGAILLQAKLSRERASIDIFLKTETDKEMLESYAAYTAGCDAFRGHHVRAAL